MAIPTLRSAAVDLYDAVQPLQYAEEEYDYALAKYCGSLGELLQQVDEYVRDTDTHVGWGTLLDPDVAPIEVLPWLGQFAGVQPEPMRQTLLYTNLITNPSAELSLSGYSALGATTNLTRIAENAAAGNSAVRALFPAAGSGSADRIEWQVNLTAGQQYTFYGSYIWTPGITGRHWITDNASTNLAQATQVSDGSRWSPYITFVATANNPHRPRWGRNAAGGSDFYTWADTWMLTAGATQFPYIDGDQPGGRWTGAPHASTSEKWEEEDEATHWARQRVRIKDKLGFERGSREAMINAAKSWLTGTKSVYFNERDTSPYHLTVSTKLSETPDPASVAAALQAQKPAGLVMVVQTIAGQDWNNLVATRASWTAVGAAYATWQAEING